VSLRFAHNGTFRCPNDWRCDRAQPRMAGSITGAATLCVFSSRFWSRWLRLQVRTITNRIICLGCSVSSDAMSPTRARLVGRAGRCIAVGLRCQRASSTPNHTGCCTSTRTLTAHLASTRSNRAPGRRMEGCGSRRFPSRQASWSNPLSPQGSGTTDGEQAIGAPHMAAATERNA
jgi:hypothetical protein